MDYIDGDKFRSICDCDIEKHDEIPDGEVVIMYASTHHRSRAIEIIENHKDRQFILVTHNSDDPVDEISIPDNLCKWFAINAEYEHEKIIPIPIGLENEHWHPQKRPILKAKHQTVNRKIKALSQFNPITFPPERQQLLRNILNNLVYADSFYCVNGEQFKSYADNLTKYAFCLCPRGNGIDTHRIWEALYMGCIPIVKKHPTHFFELDLPIIFVDYWLEVTQEFLEEKIQTIDYSLFNSPLLTMSYWKERITNEKNKYQLS